MPQCPAADFPSFFSAFARDVAVQRAFTADPLRSDSIDAAADPEPKPVTATLAGAARHFPIVEGPVPPGWRERVTRGPGGDVVVIRSVPDTDNQLRYFFRRVGDCWQLYRKADDSL